MDDKGETLYLYYTNGEYQELHIANRNKPAPQAKPVFEMPIHKYVPRGPYHIELTFDQGIDPQNTTHIHPLIAWVVEKTHGRRLLVRYDWMKAMGKMKGLSLTLRDAIIEPDGTAHAQVPINLPSCFYLDPADWSIIEKMPNLQLLRIENLIVDDFSFLSKCKNLKMLFLCRARRK